MTEQDMNQTDNRGYNKVLDTTTFKTSEADGAVSIFQKDGESDPPESVYSFFKGIVSKHPQHPALLIKRNDEWKTWSYEEYFNDSCVAAKSMIKLGLERFHGVCIMGYNSPEWLISNFGAVFAGGFSAGVYTTNSADACFIVAANCQAQIVVVENKVCLDKFLSVKDNLPHLKVLVQWSGKPSSPGVLSWDEFMAIGAAESDELLQERLTQAAVNQCCTLIYTSGTTGPPKGVMLSQDQMTYASKRYQTLMKLKEAEETLLSYLPLSHLAAHLIDIYIALGSAGTSYFASPDALKGGLGKALAEANPTFFGGVPRVWEKIYEKMQEAAGKAGMVKKFIGAGAKAQGLNYYKAMEEGRVLSTMEQLAFSAAKSLVLNKVKSALGLSRARVLVSGGAPIAPEILDYFSSLDMPIMELYGLSESLSFCSINIIEPKGFKVGSVGKVLPFTEVSLQQCNEHREGEGEICIRGRNVCMGYLRMPQKTDEAIDKDGWLHTGDIGWLDPNGFLHITGRLKELVITAGGENIPPVLIEDAVKKELPCLSQALLVGDKRKYLSILLTLKSEVNMDTGEPLAELTEGCRQWMVDNGCSFETVQEVLEDLKSQPDGKVAKLIQAGIDRYNSEHSFSHAQKIQRWTILPHDFSLATGELNNTLKKKRYYILKKYAAVIDELYSDIAVNVPCKL